MANVKFAYWGASGVRGHYTRNANAWQKISLAVNHLDAQLLIPVGGRDTIPEEFADYQRITELKLSAVARFVFCGKLRSIAYMYKAACWCREHQCVLLLPVSNEITFLGAMAASMLASVWLLCWDPPGVSLCNRSDVLSRIRCGVMDRLLASVIRRSRGLILNLHGEFANRYLKGAREKVHVFLNGTDVAHNQQCAAGVQHVPWRIAVNSAFSADKGCWEYVDLFERLWRKNNAASLVWIGHGDCEPIRRRLLAAGIPASSFTLGRFPLDESLRLLASASVAVCLYPDLPSWRWNFILKAPEFLSMGIPIVAYELPGLSAYVENGKTGCLHKSRDFEGVYRSVCALLLNADNLCRMQRAAFEKSPEYDWERINKSIAKTLLADKTVLMRCGE